MKGELYKEEEGYYVFVNTVILGTTRSLLNFDLVKYKLSLDNCEDIERDVPKNELGGWDVEIEMDIDNPCPNCGEKDNVRGNYDYSNVNKPLVNTLCNECGTYFLPIPTLDEDGCLILIKK